MRWLVTALVIAFLQLPTAHARPMLWYTLDISAVHTDIGTAPQSNGSLAGSAAIQFGVSPSSFSCGSLDLTPAGAVNNYITSTTDVQKIDAMPALTATFWMNLRSTPAHQDCLISDEPSGLPPNGQGGWELRIVNPLGGGAISASSFSLEFSQSRSNGTVVTTGGSTSPPLNASSQWVFVAVTYDAALTQRYYKATEATPVAQTGLNTIFSTTFSDNSAALRIGSSSSEPSTDRTPPAWIDDVRIYNTALSLSQLEQVKLENLQVLNMNAVPGFFDIPRMPGGLSCGCLPQALSGDGTAVVGRVGSTNGLEAFRWQNGTYTLLGDVSGGSFSSVATNVSADGASIVGFGTSATSNTAAFVWQGGVLTPLGDFPGGEDFSAAYGINATGTKVVGFSVDRPGFLATGYVWEAGVLNPLPYLPGGSQSGAWDISGDGTVIVGISDDASGYQAARFENGQVFPLGELPGGAVGSHAYRLSADKQVAVGDGTSAAGIEATIYRSGRIFNIGDLPGSTVNAGAWGVSAHGSRVVGFGRSTTAQEAFLWDRTHGMRRLIDVLQTDYGLDMTWWRLSSALGILKDGSMILASAANPAGYSTSIIIKIPPLPYIADFDNDNDVDVDDFDLFDACATRSKVPYNPGNLPPGCTMSPDVLDLIPADLDWDGDVDSDDFAIFQLCVSGENTSPPPDCRG